MSTFCQGVLRTSFSVSLLVLLVLVPSLPPAVHARQGDAAPVVVSAADASWAPTFSKREELAFSGQYIASDPAIVVEEGLYQLFYTCFIVPETGFVPEEVRAGICSATSTDGLTWTEINTGDPTTPGLVLRGIEGS